MKKLLLLLAMVFVLVPSLALAGTSDVTFQWDANSESDLGGYRMYRSTVSGEYTYGTSSPNFLGEIPAGAETYVDVAVSDGTYYWVVTAYDMEGLESGPSNEVSATLDTITNLPPASPKGLTITDITVH